VYTSVYAFVVRTETLSVREAREQLPSLLERFRLGDRRPVYLGSHRRTEAVMLPVSVYDELVRSRRQAYAQAEASVRVEGVVPPKDIEVIVERWMHGEITADEMERQVAALYGAQE
jgi:PHD/YefM family antitoxin component YafN of YafNO toxin-antitoxin module